MLYASDPVIFGEQLTAWAGSLAQRRGFREYLAGLLALRTGTRR